MLLPDMEYSRECSPNVQNNRNHNQVSTRGKFRTETMKKRPLVEVVNASVRPFLPSGSTLEMTGRHLARMGNGRGLNGGYLGAVLRDINFALHEDQHFLVCGGNGSGKSTLANVLRGKAQCLKGTLRHREDCPPSKIGIVSIESDAKILQTVEKVEKFGSWNRLKWDDLFLGNLVTSNRQMELLKQFGMDQQFSKHVSSLSAGELRKFVLMEAFSKDARVAILDEPFDGLDRRSKEDLAEFIQDYSFSNKQRFILISHRESEVKLLGNLLTHVVELEAGAIKRNERFSESLLPKIFEKERSTKTLERSRQKGKKGETLVSMKNVRIAWGGKEVLAGFDWEVKRGDFWVVSGPNGAGKSSLLEIISGHNAQVFGNDVKILGKHRLNMSLEEIQQTVELVSPKQHTLMRNQHIPLRELIKEEAHSRRFEEVCNTLGILDMDSIFSMCSQGQQRAIILARALARAPHLLLLDEFLNGLSTKNRIVAKKLLEDFLRPGDVAIVTATHGQNTPKLTVERKAGGSN